MAKNFGNAGSSKKIKEVAKANNEKANIIQIKMISFENLVDYPDNNEDTTRTVDLETSMKEVGFATPLEVTDFGMDDGKYMVLSGHRRKAAAHKVGIAVFPCIVRHFNSELEIKNYVSLMNNSRDSGKDDPLLLCNRYKMHEAIVLEQKEAGEFKGSVRARVAERMGLSTQQADRYKQMTKVIFPVWDMVRAGEVGMSSVLPMSNFEPKEQEEIHLILTDCIAEGEKLTRDMCKKLIDGFRVGKKSYCAIMEDINSSLSVDTPRDFEMNNESAVSSMETTKPVLNDSTKTDVCSTTFSENEENEFSDITTDADGADVKDIGVSISAEDVEDNDSSLVPYDKEGEKIKRQPLSEHEKFLLAGERISKSLANIEDMFNNFFDFENEDKAESFLRQSATVMQVICEELLEVSYKYNLTDKYCKVMGEAKKNIEENIESLSNNK